MANWNNLVKTKDDEEIPNSWQKCDNLSLLHSTTPQGAWRKTTPPHACCGTHACVCAHTHTHHILNTYI